MLRLLEENDNDSKKYMLWIVLGSLVGFLMLAAFVIELLLSRSKKNERKEKERIKRKEQQPEQTQIESNMLYDHSTTRKDDIRQVIKEEDEDN